MSYCENIVGDETNWSFQHPKINKINANCFKKFYQKIFFFFAWVFSLILSTSFLNHNRMHDLFVLTYLTAGRIMWQLSLKTNHMDQQLFVSYLPFTFDRKNWWLYAIVLKVTNIPEIEPLSVNESNGWTWRHLLLHFNTHVVVINITSLNSVLMY